jgi:drug/metabolite transporter (DMT)-like permease
MTENMRGIIAILLTSTAFVMNDALVKLASAELPVGEIIVVRGVIATAMLVALAGVMGALKEPRNLLAIPMVVRMVTATLSTLFIIKSLSLLPLPTVTAVTQVTPLAVTVGAAVLLGERIGWRRWVAALIGFVGMLMIVRPDRTGFTGPAWIVVAALIFTTARDLSTRWIAPAIPALTVASASSVLITLGGFVFLPFETWIMPSRWALMILTIASCFLVVAYVTIVYAMRTGEIGVVSPFRYSLIPLSIFLGYYWWGDMPEQSAGVGIVLVIAAGIYTIHRERVVSRAARAERISRD